MILVILGGLGVGFSEKAQKRISGAFDLDRSAGARIESWKGAIEIWGESPVLGVGWNWLKKVQEEKGMVVSEEVHSASGADSSVLTILATMGPVGALLFLGFWLELLALGVLTWKKRRQAAGLGLGVGILVLLISACFVNLLLLPLALVPVWGAAVLVLREDQSSL